MTKSLRRRVRLAGLMVAALVAVGAWSAGARAETRMVGKVQLETRWGSESVSLGQPTTAQVQFVTLRPWAELGSGEVDLSAMSVECADAITPPTSPTRVSGTRSTFEIPFTPTRYGECLVRIQGTLRGQPLDVTLSTWVQGPADEAAESSGGRGFPVLPAVGGGLAVLALGGGMLVASRRGRASGRVPSGLVNGRYEVVRLLGEGASKRVYLARDTAMSRDVALASVKRRDLTATEAERLRREVQSMAALGDHPNIVTVYDTGEDDGAVYITTQFMPGGSVADLVSSGPLPLDRSLQVAADVAGALARAHAAGIVHRDVKAGNVWMGSDGVAKLGDFGLAGAEASELTNDGQLLGTVAYMAPEVISGKPAGPASDLYSLGILLFQMLTGSLPFSGEPAAVLHGHTSAEPDRVSSRVDVPSDLDDLVAGLLAKRPARRPGPAADVVDQLASIADTAGVALVRRSPVASAAAYAPAHGIGDVLRSVAGTSPDLSMHAASDGTVTLMFTDIESSTPMAERLGDRGYLEVLREYDRMIREAVGSRGGSVVDTAGDGFLIAFGSARDAVRCAVDVQQALGRRKRTPPLSVRIGVHTGEAIKDADRFVGRHVHYAARVASHATGGQVLVSSVTRELVRGEPFDLRKVGAAELKGFEGEHELFELALSAGSRRRK